MPIVSTLRTPQFDERIAADWLAYRRVLLSMCREDMDIEPDGSEVGEAACIACADLAGRLVSMEYMAGLPLDQLRSLVREQVGVARNAMDWVRRKVSKPYAAGFVPIRHVRDAFALLCAGLCLFDQKGAVDEIIDLCRPLGDTVDAPGGNALFDRIAQAWRPDCQPPQAVDPQARDTAWTTPVLIAISQPAGLIANALSEHMTQWADIARDFGWTAQAGNTAEVFPYMAYEVALAVCLLDVDDAGFRDHPCYPRDLVDHYREHLRHTRDADRVPMHADGPAQAVLPTAGELRADLSGSARQGLARWLELVCDGDESALERVAARTGLSGRAPVAGGRIMAALVERDNLAVSADIKDAQTLESQLRRLAQQRGLHGFDPTELPAAGPARAQSLLLAFDKWAAARGYRLVGVDLHDDSWNAVVVRSSHLEELLRIGQTLGLSLHDATDLFDDARVRPASELFSAIVAEAQVHAPAGWQQLIVEGRVADGAPILPGFWAKMIDGSVRRLDVAVPLSTVRALAALQGCWFKEGGGRWVRIRVVYESADGKVSVDCDPPALSDTNEPPGRQ